MYKAIQIAWKKGEEMLSQKTRFVDLCTLVLATAVLAFVPARSRADVSVSYVHHVPPIPQVSYDTVTYSANLSGMPYIMGWTLYLKDWGRDEPNAATDAGTDANIIGGSGSASTGSTTDFWPGSWVQEGVWIAYHIKGIPSDGSMARNAFTGWYAYHPGS